MLIILKSKKEGHARKLYILVHIRTITLFGILNSEIPAADSHQDSNNWS